MVQFNLLPDVKLAYIKAMRRKRMVMVTATLVMAASLTVMVLLFLVVHGVQRRHINNLNSRIKESVSNLQGTENLDKILTVQNQLMKLTDLHDQKPVTSRLFTYLTQITPVEVNVARLDIDFTTQTLTLNGTATDFTSINKFVDTLKFTTYAQVDESGQPLEGTTDTKAFSKVVLSSFGRTDVDASYNVTLSFDPAIFDSSKVIKLTVPNTITTRSETEKPLFDQIEGEE